MFLLFILCGKFDLRLAKWIFSLNQETAIFFRNNVGLQVNSLILLNSLLFRYIIGAMGRLSKNKVQITKAQKIVYNLILLKTNFLPQTSKTIAF